LRSYEVMSSLRGSPRANQQSGATKYNKRLKSISSYILERLPGFRRKTSVDNENDASPRSDISDSVSDLQGRVTKTSASSNPKNKFKAPHLLPSLSESHINNKSTKSGASSKATKKILVSSSSSGYDNAPSNVKSGTKHEMNRSSSKQSQSNRTPASEYSASTVSASSSSSSAQKKHSPTSPAQDYSSSTVDSDTSGRYHHQYPSQQYNQYTNNLYRGGHSSVTATTSPNVVIFGNNNKSHQSGEKADTTGTSRSTAASLLSQIGFPVGNGKSSTESKVIPSSGNSQVISVKPAAQSTSTTNHNATSTSSTTSSDHRHGRSRAHPPSSQNNPYETPTLTANTTSALSASAPASKNGISSGTPAVTAAAPGAPPAGANKAKLCCDKCDGKHLTEECPYYKKSREDHPDAQKNKQIGGVSSLPGNMLYTAKVVRQPGDGSCLFHSMSYGLPVKSNAARLRAEICQFIQNNPHLKISDTPLQDWVKWDANSTVGEYARKMSRGSWGGGIEMACFSLLKECNVHVYEKCMLGYKRISAFDHPIEPEHKPVVRVLYCGGVHYDALVTSGQ